MTTTFGELQTGDWFMFNGERMMKTLPFARLDCVYWAVSLTDGTPRFDDREDGRRSSAVEVEKIEKPAEWAAGGA